MKLPFRLVISFVAIASALLMFAYRTTSGEEGSTRKSEATKAPVALQTPEQSFPLLPRQLFFGNPEKIAPRMSPDRKKIAYVAPVDGVLNIWVGPIDRLDEVKAVTHNQHRGISSYFWAYTNQHIIYLQDKNGDEGMHIYSIDLETGEIKDLTPLDRISASLKKVSDKFPEEIVVGINDRDDHEYHDIYRVNIITADRKLIQENNRFTDFFIDDEFRIRFAFA